MNIIYVDPDAPVSEEKLLIHLNTTDVKLLSRSYSRHNCLLHLSVMKYVIKSRRILAMAVLRHNSLNNTGYKLRNSTTLNKSLTTTSRFGLASMFNPHMHVYLNHESLPTDSFSRSYYLKFKIY